MLHCLKKTFQYCCNCYWQIEQPTRANAAKYWTFLPAHLPPFEPGDPLTEYREVIFGESFQRPAAPTGLQYALTRSVVPLIEAIGGAASLDGERLQ